LEWIFTIAHYIPSASWHIACMAGPQFYGGPDLQRAGFWRAQGRIEGLQESLPFMTTRQDTSDRDIVDYPTSLVNLFSISPCLQHAFTNNRINL
jgi:hypothetical protein